MRKEHAPPFFHAMLRGCTFRQAGQVCPHLLFLRGRGPAKMLVGELPKPAAPLDKVSRGACYLRPRRYRSWALFRSSVWPSRQSMFPLTATASRISAWALRYSA